MMVAIAQHIFSRSKRTEKKTEEDIAAERERVSARLDAIKKSISAPGASKDSDGLERREPAPRKAVDMKGQLLTGDSAPIRCAIVNLSADGARVEMDNEREDLPRFMTLKFDQSGVRKKARVAWRYNNELGLSFLARPKRDEEDEEKTEIAGDA